MIDCYFSLEYIQDFASKCLTRKLKLEQADTFYLYGRTKNISRRVIWYATIRYVFPRYNLNDRGQTICNLFPT